MTHSQLNHIRAEASDDFRRLNPTIRVPATKRVKLGNGMNKTEAAYASHLECLKRAGEIVRYEWCGNQRKLHRMPSVAGHTYTPDFKVWVRDGRECEVHEVKGYRYDGGILRFDGAAAANRQHVFRMVRRTKNGWEEIAIWNLDS